MYSGELGVQGQNQNRNRGGKAPPYKGGHEGHGRAGEWLNMIPGMDAYVHPLFD